MLAKSMHCSTNSNTMAGIGTLTRADIKIICIALTKPQSYSIDPPRIRETRKFAKPTVLAAAEELEAAFSI